MYDDERRDQDIHRLQQDQEVQRLQQEEHRLAIARRNALALRVINFIYYLVGALLVLLVLRFFLRLTAANPNNTFARFIYNLSEPFVAPFSTLFVSPTFDGGASIFDINLLFAVVIYVLLAMLVTWLIRVIWMTHELE